MCSALYHSLNSDSASGATFIAISNSAAASFGAILSPGNSCSPSKRISPLRKRAVRFVQGDEFGAGNRLIGRALQDADIVEIVGRHRDLRFRYADPAVGVAKPRNAP